LFNQNILIMSNTPTINLKGKSGTEFTFYIYDLNTTFKSVGGIYAFTKRTQNSNGTWNHTILYIGKTEDFSTRFTNHHKANCYLNKGADRLCIRQVDTESEREKMEKDLIQYYNPPCNDQLTQ